MERKRCGGERIRKKERNKQNQIRRGEEVDGKMKRRKQSGGSMRKSDEEKVGSKENGKKDWREGEKNEIDEKVGR